MECVLLIPCTPGVSGLHPQGPAHIGRGPAPRPCASALPGDSGAVGTQLHLPPRLCLHPCPLPSTLDSLQLWAPHWGFSACGPVGAPRGGCGSFADSDPLGRGSVCTSDPPGPSDPGDLKMGRWGEKRVGQGWHKRTSPSGG